MSGPLIILTTRADITNYSLERRPNKNKLNLNEMSLRQPKKEQIHGSGDRFCGEKMRRVHSQRLEVNNIGGLWVKSGERQ